MWRRHSWWWLWAASLGAALVSGIVDPFGAVAAIAFAAGVLVFSRPNLKPAAKISSAVLVLVIATGFMLHRVPGFHNPRVIDAVRFTADALPFSLYLNYDKALIGLFILGWCHPRLASLRETRAMLAMAAPRILAVIALVLPLSLALGYVRFAPKLPGESSLWLGVNLLFTCVAEEALFRGFVQEQLQRRWASSPRGAFAALGSAAMLFGLAHAAGGPAYVLLATIAGLGYGWIYQRAGWIEASILAHLALNAVHFFVFTYPALQPAN